VCSRQVKSIMVSGTALFDAERRHPLGRNVSGREQVSSRKERWSVFEPVFIAESVRKKDRGLAVWVDGLR